VAELRKLVETASRVQFATGDYALEVEPMASTEVPPDRLGRPAQQVAGDLGCDLLVLGEGVNLADLLLPNRADVANSIR
jgi:hypothetical protein